jgi:hypothetical protein
MKKSIVLILSIFFFTNVYSQDTSGKLRPLIFKADVYNDKGIAYSNYLVQVNDSNVLMSLVPLAYTKLPADLNSLKLITYNEIDHIKIKRKGAVGRGALTGGLIGLGTGLIIGLVEGDDEPDTWFSYTAGEKAVMYGAALGIAGGLIGAVIGAIATKKFIIKGSPSALKELNITLLERVYGK